MALPSVLDWALDRSIVLGYSNLGYLLRSRAWGDEPRPGALAGRVALVTGASAGLGRETAAGLARLGARVHMLVRDRGRGEDARAEIARDVPGAELELELCDISTLASVERFCADFVARNPELHVLVHNAGTMPPRREVTDEGHELTFATHVLGPHLMTALLVPALRAGAPSRVLWVSSGGMYGQRLPSDDLEFERGDYSGTTAYARTKRMQVILAAEWAERLAGTGVVVHSLHPGWADTPGLADSLPVFRRLTRPLLRNPRQGADTAVWLAAAEEPARSTGRFWHDRRPRPEHYLSRTRETPAECAQLWDACVRATGRP